MDYGANSGQIAVYVKKVSGAKLYFIRYAVTEHAELALRTCIILRVGTDGGTAFLVRMA
jgi:hypothetical protein